MWQIKQGIQALQRSFLSTVTFTLKTDTSYRSLWKENRNPYALTPSCEFSGQFMGQADKAQLLPSSVVWQPSAGETERKSLEHILPLNKISALCQVTSKSADSLQSGG